MGCFLIQLTTCLSFILFILLDEMDMKSSASGRTLDGQSESQLSNHQNYHHPLHPDWKFTYHRVYPGNQTSPTSILGTKRKSTGIAAMSIMAIKDKGKMSLRAPATTTTTTLSPSIRKHQWSSILEQEFMQSFAAGGARGQRQEEFHWRPWISDADLELTSQHPQRHLSRHSHKRRHWKRHRHDDTSHRHTNTDDTDFLRSIG